VARVAGVWTRLIAGVTAVIGWSALALQLAIMLGAMPLVPALWRFIGFFTILTNILVAAMATRIAAGRPGGLAGPAARMAVTASILLVGLAYWLLLAPLWTPTGSQLAADIALHSVQPVLATALWLMMRDGSLGWRDVPKAAIWPGLYAGYAVARGTIDRWYAYWFLNPKDQSFGELLLSIAGLAILVMILGAALVALDRTRRSRA
jgi:hypothetical protein